MRDLIKVAQQQNLAQNPGLVTSSPGLFGLYPAAFSPLHICSKDQELLNLYD